MFAAEQSTAEGRISAVNHSIYIFDKSYIELLRLALIIYRCIHER